MSHGKICRSSFLALILMVCCLLLESTSYRAVFSATKNTAVGSSFLNYNNVEYGLEMKYPKAWTVREDIQGLAFAFISPLAGGQDEFRENIVVMVVDLAQQPMNLEEFTDQSIANTKESIPNLKIEKKEKITLSKNPGYLMVSTFKPQEQQVKQAQVWTVTHNKAYFLQYTAMHDQFERYYADFETVIKSFIIN